MALTQNRADETIALKLMQAIREAGEAAVAPQKLELVSTTLDVTGQRMSDDVLSYDVAMDRKTRTILFTGGNASSGSKIVMTATAVYRIVSA